MSYRPCKYPRLSQFIGIGLRLSSTSNLCSISLKPWFWECNVTYLSSYTQPVLRMKNAIDADFLIFDLGNVIIDIDYHRSFKLLKSLLSNSFDFKVDSFYTTDFHQAYEKGEIDSPTFRNEVRNYFQQNWDDQKVDELWNSLLGKIPRERLDLISKLKQSYQVGVLSNTNEIHIDAVYKMLERDFGMKRFEPLFDRVFYSHEMGLAKPSAEIYQKMLQDLDTSADRVVFFDDLEANVKGAASVGIQAVHVTGPNVIFDFFGYV
jgi:glucose-1-phosphatase